jgi:fructokinase
VSGPSRGGGRLYGGIEAGGAKWVCAVGNGPEDMRGTTTFPTTEPDETIARAVEFFAQNGSLAAVGVGSFGPVDLRRSSRSFGFITTTPKPGWAQTNVAGRLQDSLDVPVAFDTDVNAAALGEQRWGAAVGLGSFCYVTVGTGIGGGVVVNGRLVHGLLHPELGHMRIPHDRVEDPFPGSCPYHGDCFEGLASGEAMRQRWGHGAHELTDDEPWKLEAQYLAFGLVNVIYALSPERIILGGGVMKEPTLLSRVKERLRELLAGYFDAPEFKDAIGDFVVRPGLGDRAGVLGAIALAQDAALPTRR